MLFALSSKKINGHRLWGDRSRNECNCYRGYERLLQVAFRPNNNQNSCQYVQWSRYLDSNGPASVSARNNYIRTFAQTQTSHFSIPHSILMQAGQTPETAEFADDACIVIRNRTGFLCVPWFNSRGKGGGITPTTNLRLALVAIQLSRGVQKFPKKSRTKKKDWGKL